MGNSYTFPRRSWTLSLFLGPRGKPNDTLELGKWNWRVPKLKEYIFCYNGGWSISSHSLPLIRTFGSLHGSCNITRYAREKIGQNLSVTILKLGSRHTELHKPYWDTPGSRRGQRRKDPTSRSRHRTRRSRDIIRCKLEIYFFLSTRPTRHLGIRSGETNVIQLNSQLLNLHTAHLRVTYSLFTFSTEGYHLPDDRTFSFTWMNT